MPSANRVLRQHLARNVRRYRKQRGLKQAELAEQAEICQAYVTRIEQSTPGCNVTVDVIERLALALGVCPCNLLADLQDAPASTDLPPVEPSTAAVTSS